MRGLLKYIPFAGKWVRAGQEWKDVIEQGSKIYQKYWSDKDLPDDIQKLLKEIADARKASSKHF